MSNFRLRTWYSCLWNSEHHVKFGNIFLCKHFLNFDDVTLQFFIIGFTDRDSTVRPDGSAGEGTISMFIRINQWVRRSPTGILPCVPMAPRVRWQYQCSSGLTNELDDHRPGSGISNATDEDISQTADDHIPQTTDGLTENRWRTNRKSLTAPGESTDETPASTWRGNRTDMTGWEHTMTATREPADGIHDPSWRPQKIPWRP